MSKKSELLTFNIVYNYAVFFSRFYYKRLILLLLIQIFPDFISFYL